MILKFQVNMVLKPRKLRHRFRLVWHFEVTVLRGFYKTFLLGHLDLTTPILPRRKETAVEWHLDPFGMKVSVCLAQKYFLLFPFNFTVIYGLDEPHSNPRDAGTGSGLSLSNLKNCCENLSGKTLWGKMEAGSSRYSVNP